MRRVDEEPEAGPRPEDRHTWRAADESRVSHEAFEARLGHLERVIEALGSVVLDLDRDVPAIGEDGTVVARADLFETASPTSCLDRLPSGGCFAQGTNDLAKHHLRMPAVDAGGIAQGSPDAIAETCDDPVEASLVTYCARCLIVQFGEQIMTAELGRVSGKRDEWLLEVGLFRAVGAHPWKGIRWTRARADGALRVPSLARSHGVLQDPPCSTVGPRMPQTRRGATFVARKPRCRWLDLRVRACGPWPPARSSPLSASR